MAALSTEDVLRDEAKAIHGEDRCKTLDGKSGDELYRELNKLDSAALCLSGGGIRSAAFALGVIQALAVHPRPVDPAGKVQKGQHVANESESLLAKFNYLSTVSGGGYIGGWLSAWVTRAGFPAVWASLVGRPSGSDIEPPVIEWLRAYSNYLTPKLGIISADSWAAVALAIRNLILNWFVILPVLCLVLLVLKFFAILFVWFSQFDEQSCGPWFYSVLGLGCLCLIIALRFTTSNRPTRGDSRADQTEFLFADLLPSVGASILIMFALASPSALTIVGYLLRYGMLPGSGMKNWWALYIPLIVIGVVVYAFAWIISYLRLQNYQPHWQHPKDYGLDFIAWIVAGGVFGAAMALGVYLYYVYLQPFDGIWIFQPPEILLIVFGVPWTLTAQLFAEMIFVGLSSSEADSDTDREWLGRAAGWYLVSALGWLIMMFLVFVGSSFVATVFQDYSDWFTGGAAGAGAGAGGLTAWLGKSQITPAQGAAKGWKALSANALLAIGATVFAVALIILASALLDQALLGKSLIDTPEFYAKSAAPNEWPAWTGRWSLLIAIAIAVVIGLVSSLTININRFSLHALYRNRIVRAFLGASHAERRIPNPFTNFDMKDNLRVCELWPPEDMRGNMHGAGWQPFHVVNITLNAAASTNLAWQERKAETFTVSPLHAGTAAGHLVANDAGFMIPHGAFRPSDKYGDSRGISLGTAVAISGAAASPNMGYHSSPALALLLTMFNVRLGWWLGNPDKDNEGIYGSEGPQRAIVPLICEMFGLTNDKSNYVYLSDGGHFENLGLYEMVRRRCKFIVVSDAGCDPDFAFEDLGNAARKISIDLGVTVTFNELEKLKKRPAEGDVGLGSPYWSIGEIDYPSADGGSEMGYIIYIKSGYHGVEGVGIRAYAIANRDFPHQSTGDQFFSESQFESYRALGFEIVDGLLKDALAVKTPPDMSLKGIFDAIKQL
jgi:hypothetical protein